MSHLTDTQTVLDEVAAILNDPSLPDADRQAYAALLRRACAEWRRDNRQSTGDPT